LAKENLQKLKDSKGPTGQFTKEEIQHLSRDMIMGMNYLHMSGITHRDLKLGMMEGERE
jgi:serine/threonine protein kinase